MPSPNQITLGLKFAKTDQYRTGARGITKGKEKEKGEEEWEGGGKGKRGRGRRKVGEVEEEGGNDIIIQTPD